MKQSIINDPFPHYHRDPEKNVTAVRVSSILKQDLGSLHFKVTFGECTPYFLRLVHFKALQGIRIHDAIRRLFLGAQDATTELNDAEAKKVSHFSQWQKEERVELLTDPEETLLSAKNKFSGTPDIVCRLNGSKENFVIDIKTGSKVYEINLLQAEAYRILIEELCGITIHKIGILLLDAKSENGYSLIVEKPSEKRATQFHHLLEKWYTIFPEPFGAIHTLPPRNLGDDKIGE